MPQEPISVKNSKSTNSPNFSFNQLPVENFKFWDTVFFCRMTSGVILKKKKTALFDYTLRCVFTAHFCDGDVSGSGSEISYDGDLGDDLGNDENGAGNGEDPNIVDGDSDNDDDPLIVGRGVLVRGRGRGHRGGRGGGSGGGWRGRGHGRGASLGQGSGEGG